MGGEGVGIGVVGGGERWWGMRGGMEGGGEREGGSDGGGDERGLGVGRRGGWDRGCGGVGE